MYCLAQEMKGVVFNRTETARLYMVRVAVCSVYWMTLTRRGLSFITFIERIVISTIT